MVELDDFLLLERDLQESHFLMVLLERDCVRANEDELQLALLKCCGKVRVKFCEVME